MVKKGDMIEKLLLTRNKSEVIEAKSDLPLTDNVTEEVLDINPDSRLIDYIDDLHRTKYCNVCKNRINLPPYGYCWNCSSDYCMDCLKSGCPECMLWADINEGEISDSIEIREKLITENFSSN